MILDILFYEKEPRQYQNVKKTRMYPHHNGIAKPVLILEFGDSMYPEVKIYLDEIQAIEVTND